MLSIDEAIAKYKEITNTDANCPVHCNISCDKCVQESEQLAEWLEELKAYRTLDKTNFSDGYNKGIDEAMIASANAICIGCGYLDGTQCIYKGSNCTVSKPMLEVVMKALEQLKAGESE